MGGGGRTFSVIGEQGPKYNALRIQTSTRGMVIPVVFGTTRISGNLIWYGDFHQRWVGAQLSWVDYGKGGGGTSYTMQYTNHYYDVALALALCEGPINVGATWFNKFKYKSLPSELTLFAGTYPQTPWSYLTTNHPSEALNYPGLAYLAGGAFTLMDTDSLPNINAEVFGLNILQAGTSELITNGEMETGDPPTGWTSFQNPETFERSSAQSHNGTYSAHVIDSSASLGGFRQLIENITPYKRYRLSFYYYIISGQIVVYGDDGVLTGGTLILDPKGSWEYGELDIDVHNNDWFLVVFRNNSEIKAAEFFIDDVSCVEVALDADPGDMISTILNDAKIGLGLSVPLSMNEYQNWCRATGLLLSPAFTEQALAIDVLKTILDHTFATGIWHDGSVLKFIPLADAVTTGNGCTFTPDITPKYNLTDDHFIVEGTEEPIQVTRKSPAECYNIFRIECLNRSADYNVESVEAMDQASIDTYQARPADGIKAWDICNPTYARLLIQLKLQRNLYIRNEYRFKLGWKYCLLEAMDIVTLTDSGLGMNLFPVRIKEIEEDESYNEIIVAEDFPEAIAQAPRYSIQNNSGYQTDFNINPENVNDPVIFLAPSELWENPSIPEIWIAACGDAVFWGGCDVHVSSEGSSYSYAGSLRGPSRLGVLSASLPAGSDPDQVNTCSVDLSVSQGELLSGTQIDADNLITLCAILSGNIEMITYQTATLTAQHKYDLTYLRRGKKGTNIAQHSAGASFVRIDQYVLRLPFDSSWLHSKVYFKFCSYNYWFANKQSLADVDPYEFVIQQPIGDIMTATEVITVLRSISDSGTGADSISVSK